MSASFFILLFSKFPLSWRHGFICSEILAMGSSASSPSTTKHKGILSVRPASPDCFCFIDASAFFILLYLSLTGKLKACLLSEPSLTSVAHIHLSFWVLTILLACPKKWHLMIFLFNFSLLVSCTLVSTSQPDYKVHKGKVHMLNFLVCSTMSARHSN